MLRGLQDSIINKNINNKNLWSKINRKITKNFIEKITKKENAWGYREKKKKLVW